MTGIRVTLCACGILAACGGKVASDVEERGADDPGGAGAGGAHAAAEPSVMEDPRDQDVVVATGGAGAPSGEPAGGSAEPSTAILSFSDVEAHFGCVTPPCCLGGSSDTQIEFPSKCKYLLTGLVACGCYECSDLDLAMQRCVDAYTAIGSDCGGMDSGTLASCTSVALVAMELAGFMPPMLPTCDSGGRVSIWEDLRAVSCE